jgi:hypothetical protein
VIWKTKTRTTSTRDIMRVSPKAPPFKRFFRGTGPGPPVRWFVISHIAQIVHTSMAWLYTHITTFVPARTPRALPLRFSERQPSELFKSSSGRREDRPRVCLLAELRTGDRVHTATVHLPHQAKGWQKRLPHPRAAGAGTGIEVGWEFMGWRASRRCVRWSEAERVDMG